MASVINLHEMWFGSSARVKPAANVASKKRAGGRRGEAAGLSGFFSAKLMAPQAPRSSWLPLVSSPKPHSRAGTHEADRDFPVLLSASKEGVWWQHCRLLVHGQREEVLISGHFMLPQLS